MSNIEKIKAEIERLKGVCMVQIKANPGQTFPFITEMTGYDKLLAFIDSLPEENNPEPYNPVYDEDYLNEKIAKATKSWEGVDVNKMLADCRGYEEKPSEDLEEAAENFVWEVMENDEDGISDLCRKLRPSSKISDFYDALAEFFKAGAKWQKEQMMKDAVEDALLIERAWLTLDGFGHEELAGRLRQFAERRGLIWK